METAARSTLVRPELVETSPVQTTSPTVLRTLNVTASYSLSEAGRKASLLAGGTGHSLQHLDIQVPSNRLHLVTVNGQGVARLKLRPRYELNTEQQVVCVDALPKYDSPPTPEELLREAARNHQLERAFHAQRLAERAKRSETDRVRKSEVAALFLSNPMQRAIIHPAPSPKRCYLSTKFGHMRFDIDTEEGPARDVPREALRRFRADVKAASDRRERDRAEHVRIHEERKHAIAAWVAAHGSEEQRARYAAGLLSPSEVVDALTNDAFRTLAHLKPYSHDGAAVMQSHVRHWTGRDVAPVVPADFAVCGHPARSATSGQWAALQEIQAAVSEAQVSLHTREIIWRREPGVPRYTRLTVVVTKQAGPILLRREYLFPEDDLLTTPSEKER